MFMQTLYEDLAMRVEGALRLLRFNGSVFSIDCERLAGAVGLCIGAERRGRRSRVAAADATELSTRIFQASRVQL